MEMNETMFVNVICNCTLSFGFPFSRSDSASTLPHLLIHKFLISKNERVTKPASKGHEMTRNTRMPVSTERAINTTLQRDKSAGDKQWRQGHPLQGLAGGHGAANHSSSPLR